ncbi:MAG: GyrI-like domain-containing protein [Aeromicrobium erythreum]
MTEKVDLRRVLDGYRARRGELRLLDLPLQRYLMVDGHGDPNTSPAFDEALRTLYPVAYTTKFASRAELGRDYVVPPLEGLWWAEDLESFTSARDKTAWSWTLLLLVPDWVEDALVERSVEQVRAKRAPRLEDLRLDVLDEGRCLQTLHVGSFDDEGPVLARMHDEIVTTHGLRLAGRHHEIYLSDVRRTAPERRRTILRQPVRGVAAGSG